jgi:hypothetical protein
MAYQGELIMATVRISGNWRNPNKMEWGGALEIDETGQIDRGLEIPEEVYLAIEEAIQGGNVEGNIHVEDGPRFHWVLDA